MARVDQFPSMDIIAGFRGVLDFYSWKGLKIVRKWPVITGHRSTPGEKKNQNAFREFQKDLKNIMAPVKDLWRGTARLAHWRWHEVHYRWYRGAGMESLYPSTMYPFPPYKPHPRYNPLFFKIYNAFWMAHGGQLYLVFLVDSLQPHMTVVHSNRTPIMEQVLRVQRGKVKDCGTTPVRWESFQYHDLDWGLFGETPPVSHYLIWPPAGTPIVEGMYGQVINHRGSEFGWASWYPTHLTYSSGPPFVFSPPRYMPEESLTQPYWWPIQPLTTNPRWPYRPRWLPLYVLVRSWKWPYVPDPGYPGISWRRISPFEERPPPSYPYPPY